MGVWQVVGRLLLELALCFFQLMLQVSNALFSCCEPVLCLRTQLPLHCWGAANVVKQELLWEQLMGCSP